MLFIALLALRLNDLLANTLSSKLDQIQKDFIVSRGDVEINEGFLLYSVEACSIFSRNIL